MFVLRLVGLLLILSLAVCVAGFLLTGDTRYRRWAGRLLRIGLAVALVFMGFLLLERLIVPIL